MNLRARIGYSSVAFVTELLPKYFYEIAPDGVLLSMLTLQVTEHTQGQFSTVRTGRATPALVDRLHATYYGAEVPLQQLATFQVPEPRVLIIKPHDRGSLAAIEKAIRDRKSTRLNSSH